MEQFTSWHSWADAEPELRRRLPEPTVAVLHQAVASAAEWHGDQRRPTGAPYTDHLLEALEILVRGAGVTDPDVLAAAVLHDTIEDTACTREDLSIAYGPRVAELVSWVTIPEAGPGQDKAAVKEASLRGLSAAPPAAILVKLADRASNVQTLRNLPLAKQRAYYAQTTELILPLTAGQPWFSTWFAQWQASHADLA